MVWGRVEKTMGLLISSNGLYLLIFALQNLGHHKNLQEYVERSQAMPKVMLLLT